MNSHAHANCDCIFTPAKMETLSTPAMVVSWLCRITGAVILLQTLYFKFTGAPESVYIFTTLGLEPWGRIGSGVVELIAAVLLLIPATAGFGAVLALGVISRFVAVVRHLSCDRRAHPARPRRRDRSRSGLHHS